MNSSEFDLDLLGYSLRLLDEDQRRSVEHRLNGNPDLNHQLDRLAHRLGDLLHDGDALEPPGDLSARTISLVAQYRRHRTIRELMPQKLPFGWADVAVAAGIFLASLLTLLPALNRSKLQMDIAGCGFNLFQVGQAMTQYADSHGAYPWVPPHCPAAYAGIYSVLLHEAGYLTDRRRLYCPSNGSGAKRAREQMPSLARLCSIPQAQAPQNRELLGRVGGDYAYHLGYYREGQRTPGPLPARPRAPIPLLADQPPFDPSGQIHEGNSPNHGRRGQNVLFSDLAVRWLNHRLLGPHNDDIYLNDAGRPEPGLHALDAVLAPCIFRFDGQ